MADIVERILAEENRHIIGYPSPRRNVAELLRAAREDIERLTRELSEARATALEEAAKVADDAAMNAGAIKDQKDAKSIGGTAVLTGYIFAETESKAIAAAIRALKEVKG